MKAPKQFYIMAIIFSALNLNCYITAQNNNIPEGYTVTLSEKTYLLKNKDIQFKDMAFFADSAIVKLLVTEQGITGIVGIGKCAVTVPDKDGKSFYNKVKLFLIRFNPENLKYFIDIEKAETTDQYPPTDMYAFYTSSFRSMYQAGNNKALIPDIDAYGIRCITEENDILHAYSFQNEKGRMLRPDMEYANKSYNSKEYEKSLSEITLVLKRHPESVEAQSLYGRTLVELGKYSDAIAPLLKAIELKDERKWITAWSYAYLGKAYYETGKKAEAEKALRKCTLINATLNANAFANSLLIKYGFEKAEQ